MIACLRAPITVLSLLAASIAHAQNPALAPARSDSIYHLAVDSAAYKDYPFVYLLDDGIVHFEADGHGTQRYHQVVQILKTQGVGVWAERQFSSRPGHDKVTVNWMRVVRPSGELISDKPSITQASDIPAAMSNSVYSDTKVVRYSLSGVTVGTLVDISWTDEIMDPYLAGDFVSSWRTTMDFPAMRSRFVLDVPASLTTRIEERHVDIKRVEQQASGRRYYVWAKQSVMPVKGEMFAPDSAIPRMGIDVVSPTKWADIARWYGGLAADRYAMSARTTAIVDSIAHAQHTAADTIAALHTWIARDIRYVSVALGMGGYQPRFPDSTVTAGFGDCKDKATLFIAAAKHLGVTAYPVLLNSSGAADSTLPTIGQFDHAIAAVANKSGGYTYLDLTTAAFEPGQIPPNYQGGFGLVVLPGGKSEEIRFPKESSGVQTTHFDGVVADDGTMSGQLELSAKGGAGTSFRAMFSQPLDSVRRAAVSRSFAAILPGAKPDTLIVSDMKDARAVPGITVRLHGADGFRRAGTVSVLTRAAAVLFASDVGDSCVGTARRPARTPVSYRRGSRVGIGYRRHRASTHRSAWLEGRAAQGHRREERVRRVSVGVLTGRADHLDHDANDRHRGRASERTARRPSNVAQGDRRRRVELDRREGNSGTVIDRGVARRAVEL